MLGWYPFAIAEKESGNQGFFMIRNHPAAERDFQTEIIAGCSLQFDRIRREKFSRHDFFICFSSEGQGMEMTHRNHDVTITVFAYSNRGLFNMPGIADQVFMANRTVSVSTVDDIGE